MWKYITFHWAHLIQYWILVQHITNTCLQYTHRYGHYPNHRVSSTTCLRSLFIQPVTTQVIWLRTFSFWIYLQLCENSNYFCHGLFKDGPVMLSCKRVYKGIILSNNCYWSHPVSPLNKASDMQWTFCFLNVTFVCMPRADVSSTFLKYGDWKPNINCNILNTNALSLTHGVRSNSGECYAAYSHSTSEGWMGVVR